MKPAFQRLCHLSGIIDNCMLIGDSRRERTRQTGMDDGKWLTRTRHAERKHPARYLTHEG